MATGELAAAILEVKVMPLTELLKFGLDLVVVHFQRRFPRYPHTYVRIDLKVELPVHARRDGAAIGYHAFLLAAAHSAELSRS